MRSKVVEVHVAGITFVAATCDSYKRLLHFFVRHASGIQHRHPCRMLWVVTYFPTVFFKLILGHGIVNKKSASLDGGTLQSIEVSL